MPDPARPARTPETSTRAERRGAMIGGLVGLGLVAVGIVVLAVVQDRPLISTGLIALAGGAFALVFLLRRGGPADRAAEQATQAEAGGPGDRP